MKRELYQAGPNLDWNASMKNRAFARFTGSAGRRDFPVGVTRSLTNSIRTSDSASLTDSVEGVAGSTSGPPYAIAGTYLFTLQMRQRLAIETEG